jgi:hypothetical protein
MEAIRMGKSAMPRLGRWELEPVKGVKNKKKLPLHKNEN